MSFDREFEKAVKQIVENNTKIVQESAKSFLTTVINRTPVGDPTLWASGRAPRGYRPGKLVANWQTTLNSKASGVLEDRDENRGPTIGKMENTVNSMKITDTVYMTNNADYAQEIEDGKSTMAPQGMVKTSIADFKNIVESFIRRMKL
jgi:hypothetical protein